MADAPAIDLIVALGDRSGRLHAARALAVLFGVDELLLFVRDPVLGVLVPAQGMPQTLHGDRTWRVFLAHCPEHGRSGGEVELPKGSKRSATALAFGRCAVVLLGGPAAGNELDRLERLLPMLSALLGAEQDAILARSEADAAKDATSRAEALSKALEAARAEAAALNAELRAEHRRKDEFLAMLGHELRNPLSPLVTSIDLLRMHPPGQRLPPGIIELMKRQTVQLTRLVDDLLDVSRVSRGRIELRREHLLLSEVVKDAVEEARPLIEARRHHLVLCGLEEPITVSADRARLVQVFGNLLNNAAKYTNPKGVITVTLSRNRQSASVRVQDTGIGIPADMLLRVFDLFTQTPAALGRAEGGLGIGLTLVRTLVELHGGQVSAGSSGIGKGTTFDVSLPLVAAVAPARDALLFDIRNAPVGKRVRVLVVDDNRDAADSISVLLRQMGHEAEVAYDGYAALRASGKSDVDIYLLDIGLPGMDGYAVARALRPSAKAGARFVALTGFGTDEGRRRTREAGFDEHIVKPVTPELLQALIEGAGK